MIFADYGNGHYASVLENHTFAGHMTLGEDRTREIVDEPARPAEPTRQLLPTQLEPLPPAPLSPTRTSSLITSQGGTYNTARTLPGVPTQTLPVPIPTDPVTRPTVPRDPAPVPGVAPDPVLSPNVLKPPRTTTTPPPVSTELPPIGPEAMWVPPATPPALLPDLPKTSSNVKWAVIGGVVILSALGIAMFLRSP